MKYRKVSTPVTRRYVQHLMSCPDQEFQDHLDNCASEKLWNLFHATRLAILGYYPDDVLLAIPRFGVITKKLVETYWS